MCNQSKKRFQIKLYQGDEITIHLTGEYHNRHEMEDMARHYINKGLAESMGAPEEVINDV